VGAGSLGDADVGLALSGLSLVVRSVAPPRKTSLATARSTSIHLWVPLLGCSYPGTNCGVITEIYVSKNHEGYSY
jgi:hypothetical protein